MVQKGKLVRNEYIFMQRRLYIDEAHTALDIFRFAVVFDFRFSAHSPNFGENVFLGVNFKTCFLMKILVHLHIVNQNRLIMVFEYICP